MTYHKPVIDKYKVNKKKTLKKEDKKIDWSAIILFLVLMTIMIIVFLRR